MPYLRVECSGTVDRSRVESLQRELTQLVHELKKDPVAMIATAVLQGVPVTFGGHGDQPACVVTLTNAAMPPSITSALTAAITRAIGDAYGVPANRIYVFFHQYTDPTLVGWNGVTFDQVMAAAKKAASGGPHE